MTPAQERAWLSARAAQAAIARAFNERLMALPIRVRLDITARAERGEDLVALLEQAEVDLAEPIKLAGPPYEGKEYWE